MIIYSTNKLNHLYIPNKITNPVLFRINNVNGNSKIPLAVLSHYTSLEINGIEFFQYQRDIYSCMCGHTKVPRTHSTTGIRCELCSTELEPRIIDYADINTKLQGEIDKVEKLLIKGGHDNIRVYIQEDGTFVFDQLIHVHPGEQTLDELAKDLGETPIHAQFSIKDEKIKLNDLCDETTNFLRQRFGRIN